MAIPTTQVRIAVGQRLLLPTAGMAAGGRTPVSSPLPATPYAGPLDLVPGAIAAYSQRAAAADWTADVLTIRRVSDDESQGFAPGAGHAVDVAAIGTWLGGHSAANTAVVTNGGHGYDAGSSSTFNVTLLGGTGTAAVVNVSTDGTGAVVVVNDIIDLGNYSVVPPNPATTTGDNGTNHGSGLTLNARYVGGFVSEWIDQSGTANDAVQETARAQPGWVASATGGRPGALFNGTIRPVGQQLATVSTVALPSGAFTLFVVLNQSAQEVPLFGASALDNGIMGINGSDAIDPNGPEFRIFVSSGAPGICKIAVSSWDFNFNNIYFYGSADLPIANFIGNALLVIRADQSAGTILFNGVHRDSNQNPGAGATTPGLTMAIGSNDAGSAIADPSTCLRGTMSEFLLYDTALSDDDLAAVSDNIAAYYGL